MRVLPCDERATVPGTKARLPDSMVVGPRSRARYALLACLLVGCSTAHVPLDAATCSADALPLYQYSGWSEHHCDDTSAEYIEREAAFVEASARLGCCVPSCCGAACHAPAETYARASTCAELERR